MRYSRKGHVFSVIKKALKSSKREKLRDLTNNFSKFRAYGCYNFKQNMVLKILTQSKANYFSKRAVCTGTAHNMWKK